MNALPPNRRPSRARLWRVIALAAVMLVLIVVLFAPQAWSLRLPTNPDSTWLLFLLSTFSFLAIVILTLVLGRQIVKLSAERRARVLGARFKTKLVIGALALSLTPVVCMFLFTYGLINRTLDKWFSQPVVTVRDDNQSTLAMLTGYVIDNARNEAQSIAASPVLATGDAVQIEQALARHQQTLEGGFAAVFGPGGAPVARFHWPAGIAVAPSGSGQLRLGGTTYALTRAATPAIRGGEVEVGMPIPAALTAQIARLAQDRDRYDRLAQQRRSLRFIYTGYLLLLTLAILFCSTWMALYLSRLITVPMAELASATQEISRGNLAYRVRVGAQDEIGMLVDSFNRMAGELEHNRQELEARRRYTETLLENTPSAVVSLSRGRGPDYAIERVNPAVARLFGDTGAAPRQLSDLFDAASLREIHHLLRKSERWPQATGQLEVVSGGRRLTLAATAAALAGGAGYVLVLEDLTDLLHIQKTAAWREVAQRIAHEIKNPLTPIALSAERIRRRLNTAPDAAGTAQAMIAECASTIEHEVRSLQRLVDEFSAYARFPHAQPVTCNLNDIIEHALRAFDGRLEGIDVRTRLDPLPPLHLDPEDMKRVFINLIDNAAEAMQHASYRQLTVATQLLDGVVEAVVADTGHGLSPADKQRLFIPYYSTKQRGTGLGLAIVQRIVEENNGSLRVEDNTPVGARFIIELPLRAMELPTRTAAEAIQAIAE